MASLPNIVILGDYEQALRRFSNWDKLEQSSNLTFHHKPLRDEALYEAVKDADAIAIVRDRSPFNEAMIARLPKLKFLMFTGERNGTLDASALIARNIPIACTPGGPSKETTAELTWALILGASKRLIEEHKLITSGGWRDQLSVLPMLSGERLGVMGLGAIGSRVARVGAAFGMEVVTWSPRMTPERAAAENAKSVSMEELLKTSKVVTMH
jgi:phosphoglycerate dehydrogenase-like enzyme